MDKKYPHSTEHATSILANSLIQMHTKPMKFSDCEFQQLARIDIYDGVEMLHASFRRQHFSKHFHQGYALGVIERGGLAFRYQGKDLVAGAGDVNLVVPGEVHDGHGANQNGWAYRMFYLTPAAMEHAATELGLAPRLPDFAKGVLQDSLLAARIRQTFASLSGPSSTLARETHVLTLLCLWIRRHAEVRTNARRPASSQAVIRAMEFLHENPVEDISLTQLAQVSCISQYHLIRTFQHVTGMTPHAYQIQLKIERVRNALQTRDSLADIAATCGFADQSHLTRLFKRHTGLTPGQYRNFILNA